VRSRPFYWSDATPFEPCAVPPSSLFEDFDLGLGYAPTFLSLGSGTPSVTSVSAVEIVAKTLSCVLDADEATGNLEVDSLRIINKSYAYIPQKLDRNNKEIRRPMGPAYGFLARNDGTASVTSNHREWAVLSPFDLGPTGLDQHLTEALENRNDVDLVLYFGDKPSALPSDLHVTRSASDIVHICGPAGRTKQVSRRSYLFLRDVLNASSDPGATAKDLKEIRRLFDHRLADPIQAKDLDAKIDALCQKHTIDLREALPALPGEKDPLWPLIFRIAKSQSNKDAA